MTKPGEPYSRLYWSALTDPMMVEVWRDDRTLALWVRLLIDADAAYPVKPLISRGNGRRSRALATLIEAGLVLVGDDGRYTMRGLEAERRRRTDRARTAALARYAPSTADALQAQSASNANGVPRREEQEKEKRKSSSRGVDSVDNSLAVSFLRSPAGKGEHKGQHPNCLVCEPMRPAWTEANR